jgi:hypothetical protein
VVHQDEKDREASQQIDSVEALPASWLYRQFSRRHPLIMHQGVACLMISVADETMSDTFEEWVKRRFINILGVVFGTR